MSEIRIYRIVFHTLKEREFFEEVKNLLLTVLKEPQDIKTFEPEDDGKKVIFFAASVSQKNKVERLLRNAGFPITISHPFVPC